MKNKNFTSQYLSVAGIIFLIAICIFLLVPQTAFAHVITNSDNIWSDRAFHSYNGRERTCDFDPAPPNPARHGATTSAWLSLAGDPAGGNSTLLSSSTQDVVNLQLNSLGYYCTGNMNPFDSDLSRPYNYGGADLIQRHILNTRLNVENVEIEPAYRSSLNLSAGNLIGSAMNLNWGHAYSNHHFYVKPGATTDSQGRGEPLNRDFSISGFSSLSPGTHYIDVQVTTRTTYENEVGDWYCVRDNTAGSEDGSSCTPLVDPFTIIVTIPPPEPEADGYLYCSVRGPDEIYVYGGHRDASTTVYLQRNGSNIQNLGTSGSWYSYFSRTDRPLNAGTAYTYRLVTGGTVLDTASCTTEENPGPADEHKIFGANQPRAAEQYVRDNRQFGIDLNAALWPDAAMRSGTRAANLWLAGTWGMGNGANDFSVSDASRRANPNYMSSFNYAAEDKCPGGACLERVPMAYVPAGDGLGFSNTSTKDGSSTPAGNNWLAIRDRPDGFNTVGVGSNLTASSANVTSCGSYNHRYNPRCGGIASTNGSYLYGRSGNWIDMVEISNIHVRGVGLSGSTTNGTIQGGINSNTLQQDVRANTNLPSGSQGPINAGGSAFNAWDNIRPPGSANSGFTLSITNSTAQFENNGVGVRNFTYNPYSMTSSYQNLLSQVGGGNVVALLQDGNDQFDPEDYPNKQEPLTYTWGITDADRVDLMWDEYVQWSQIDDKGHWYTRRTSGRSTGVDRGPGERRTFSLNRIRETSDGSRERAYYVDRTCWGWSWSTGYYEYDCGYWVYTSRSTYCVSGTRIAYNYTTRGYYYGSSQTRFGWLNDSKGSRGTLSGTNLSSYFASNPALNPSWAQTGYNYHWQDTSVTDMSNAGFSGGTGGRSYWDYDRSDRAYSDRYIYNQYRTVRFRSGAYRTGTSCISRYPNGSHYTYSTSQTSATYYPNSRNLYENSSSASGYVYGTYGTAAANRAGGDGVADGVVDYGWRWRSNLQRVKYENTYEDHYRKLGPRRASGTPGADNILYGLNPNASNINQRRMKVSRTAGRIVSPNIAISDADVFAAGGIDSYFTNSFAQSAFLFSNNFIRNFQRGSNQNQYEQYWINPDDDRVRASADYTTNYQLPTTDLSQNGNDAISSVLQDELADLLESPMDVNDSNFSGSTFNLDQHEGRNYLYEGANLTINGSTNFCNGNGVIIVKGDLTINGDIGYCNSPSSDRADIPSVGFLVFGDINIRPNVRSVQGAYFATGTIHTGSVLLAGGNSETPLDDRSSSDVPLNIRGLMIAHRFILARQLSGQDNVNTETESFSYDGRIVLNPPPGFDAVYRFPSAWNEAAPSN